MIKSTLCLFLVLLALLPATGRAEEVDCPWSGRVELDVRANMTRVQVADRIYRVNGPVARHQFRQPLVACHASPEAVFAFERWRGSRRATNTGAALLFTGNWVGAVIAPVTAGQAGRWRGAFLYYMNQPAESDALVDA